jgi:hypothetical protein
MAQLDVALLCQMSKTRQKLDIKKIEGSFFWLQQFDIF